MIDKLLLDNDLWNSIFQSFYEKSFRQRKKIKEYRNILENNKHIEITKQIISNNYTFSFPRKTIINKSLTNKKKIVYLFNFEEDFFLKVLNNILSKKYSHLISPNCHSFQKNKGAKTAFKSITNDTELHKKAIYKTDIKNFFNSVNIDYFFSILPIEITNNNLIFNILFDILKNDKVYINGEIFTEKKGLMAGMALSPFLSNLYFRQIDDYFYNNKITYARYSDDIIFFDYPETIQQHIDFLHSTLATQNLTINNTKTYILSPNSEWTFLGFTYNQKIIDIAISTQTKFKARIKRLGKRYNKLYKKGKYAEKEILTFFITKINRKFFGKNNDNSDLSWSKWYFPLINTHKSLKIIDLYIQNNLRFCICGVYKKTNYKRIPYNLLKQLGYKTLTNTFFLFKNDFEKFNKIE